MLKNRTVWLFGVAGIMALSSAGCIIGDTDDSAFVVDWDLMYVPPASNPNEAIQPTCDQAGTPKVDLDAKLLPNGPVHHETFDCKDRRVITDTLAPGRYEVTVALKNGLGRAVSSLTDQFELGRNGRTALPSLLFGIQSFRMTWSLARGSAGVTCESVNAKTVTLTAMLGSDPMMTIDFPCNAYMGETPAIPTGSYNVHIQLLNGAGAVLSDIPAMNFPVSGSTRADLPPLTFGVN
jgi:hypothetical protein